MTAKPVGTLLVIDDESDIRELIEHDATAVGFDVLEACDGPQAREVVRTRRVDVVLCDLVMPRQSGLELLRELRDEGFNAPFIFLTGFPSQESILQALRLGAFDYLEKPFNSEELRALLADALRVSTEINKLTPRLQTPGPDGQPIEKKDDAGEPLWRLRALRYGREESLSARFSGQPGDGARRALEMFASEVTAQLVFCDAAIKALWNPDERAFELAYLFRVMQGVAEAAAVVAESGSEQCARCAERFYTVLRVKPRTVTGEIISLAQSVNDLLRTRVARATAGGVVMLATELQLENDILDALNEVTKRLEEDPLRVAG